MTAIDVRVLDELEKAFRGELVRPHDPGYDEARRVYNAMIDRRPSVVARCRDREDVVRAVHFARDNGVDIAVRGGGHSAAGLATVEGGLVIDLGALSGVRVDPEARTATVGGGATWDDVDRAAHPVGLAMPAGRVSTTGVGGLTLGGGHGYLTRKYGLVIDNLLSAEVVLADGSLVMASENGEEDLFWALRGGGGNFGVVTSFTFRLHPVSTVLGGPTLWSLRDADRVMRWYREFQPSAPGELSGLFAFLTVPPAPPFPEDLHLQKVCGIVWCYAGPAGEGEKAIAPALEVAEPLLHGAQEMPFPMLQRAFDDAYPPGHQWYWRGDYFSTIPDDAIAACLDFAAKAPTPQSTIHFNPIDGTPHSVGHDETAFSHRDATWSVLIAGVDPQPASADQIRSWTVDCWEALHPYSQGAADVNFMMDEGRDRVRATYRDNYERLRRVKAKYDPDNLFHFNQNIPPLP